ncbi:hypothetical protein C0J52_19947 [Blattella germanica]|nr:hypothetical protein C0J52_19947 [Blattella germanica]
MIHSMNWKYLYYVPKILNFISFSMCISCASCFYTISDRWFRYVIPLTVQVYFPPNKRDTKQNRDFFSSLIVSHDFLSNQDVEKHRLCLLLC